MICRAIVAGGGSYLFSTLFFNNKLHLKWLPGLEESPSLLLLLDEVRSQTECIRRQQQDTICDVLQQ